MTETFSKPGVADVTPADYKKISPIVRHYAKMAHPFTVCKRDQIKHGLSEDHANRRCAVVKMLGGRGTGGKSKITAADVEGLELTRTELNEVAADAWERLDVIEVELGEGTVERLLTEAVLTAKSRKGLDSSAFVFPKTREYPIHDRRHGGNALARAKGKPEYGKVKSAVCSKYKDLPACSKSQTKAQEAEMEEARRRVLREDLAEEVLESFACIEAADRPRHREGVWARVAESVLEEVGHPDAVEEPSIEEAEIPVSGYIRHGRRGDLIHVDSYSRASIENIINDLAKALGHITAPGHEGPTELHGPEGIKVKAITHGRSHRFRLSGGKAVPGEGTTPITGTARETAKLMANRSVRMDKPESIGGARRYKGAVSYQRERPDAMLQSGYLEQMKSGEADTIPGFGKVEATKGGFRLHFDKQGAQMQSFGSADAVRKALAPRLQVRAGDAGDLEQRIEKLGPDQSLTHGRAKITRVTSARHGPGYRVTSPDTRIESLRSSPHEAAVEAHGRKVQGGPQLKDYSVGGPGAVYAPGARPLGPGGTRQTHNIRGLGQVRTRRPAGTGRDPNADPMEQARSLTAGTNDPSPEGWAKRYDELVNNNRSLKVDGLKAAEAHARAKGDEKMADRIFRTRQQAEKRSSKSSRLVPEGGKVRKSDIPDPTKLPDARDEGSHLGGHPASRGPGTTRGGGQTSFVHQVHTRKGGDYTVQKAPGAIDAPAGTAQRYQVTKPDGTKATTMALTPERAVDKVAEIPMRGEAGGGSGDVVMRFRPDKGKPEERRFPTVNAGRDYFARKYKDVPGVMSRADGKPDMGRKEYESRTGQRGTGDTEMFGKGSADLQAIARGTDARARRAQTELDRRKQNRSARRTKREGPSRPDSTLKGEVDRANAKANAGGLRAQQRDAEQKKGNGRKPSLPLPSERRKPDTRTTRRDKNGAPGKGKTPKRSRPDGGSAGDAALVKRGANAGLSVPEKHQLAIAKRTLRASDAGARILGGMTKAEARAIIQRLTRGG